MKQTLLYGVEMGWGGGGGCHLLSSKATLSIPVPYSINDAGYGNGATSM